MNRVRHRILKGVSFTALEKVSVQVISVLSFFVIINNLSLKDYGLFTLFFSIVSVGSTIALLGSERLIIAEAAMMRAKEAYDSIRKLFTEFAFIAVILLILLCTSGWLLIDVVERFYDADFKSYFVILALLIGAQTGVNYSTLVFNALELFKHNFLVSLLESIVKISLIFSLFFTIGFSLTSILWVYVVAKLVTVAMGLFFAVHFLREKKGASTQSASLLTTILREHGKWEVARSFLNTAASNVWPWIIHAFVSTEGVAIYAFVQKINSFVTRALPIRSVLFPVIIHSVEKSKKLAIVIIAKARKYLLAVYLCVYLFSYVFLGYLITQFVPQYSDAETLVQLSMLRLFVDVVSLGHLPVLYALKQQRLVFYMNLISTPIMIVMQILFTYLWGIKGMVFSVLLFTLVSALIREYLLMKKFDFRFFVLREFFTYDQYDKLLLRKLRDKILRRKNVQINEI